MLLRNGSPSVSNDAPADDDGDDDEDSLEASFPSFALASLASLPAPPSSMRSCSKRLRRPIRRVLYGPRLIVPILFASATLIAVAWALTSNDC